MDGLEKECQPERCPALPGQGSDADLYLASHRRPGNGHLCGAARSRLVHGRTRWELHQSRLRKLGLPDCHLLPGSIPHDQRAAHHHPRPVAETDRTPA